MEFWLHVSDGFKETCKAPIVCKLPFLKKITLKMNGRNRLPNADYLGIVAYCIIIIN